MPRHKPSRKLLRLTPTAGASSPRVRRRRGRRARVPSQIPPIGWRDILLRGYRSIIDDRLPAVAASVTFYAILAIFPGIAAFVAIYGLFADPDTIASVLDTLSSVLPASVLDILGDQMRLLAAHGRTTLGLAFLVSLCISLWSANSGVKALFDALNVVYHEREKRSFLGLNALSFGFTLGTLLFGLLALAAVAVLPVALSYLGLDGSMTAEALGLARWPVLLLCVTGATAILYRYGPSREPAQWDWVSLGSILAALMWLAVSMLFSWYTVNVAKYAQVYGALAAPVAFMMWIWLSTIVVLLGAELDAEMEHQTARDTTTGAPQPLGRRGAHMADTIGPAQD